MQYFRDTRYYTPYPSLIRLIARPLLYEASIAIQEGRIGPLDHQEVRVIIKSGANHRYALC